MHVSPRTLRGLAAGAVLFLAALSLPAVRAQSASKEGAQVVVYLNDGFVLQGMDRREGKYEIEGQDVVFIANGFFFLDDGVRRQYFGSRLLREVKPKTDLEEDKVLGKREIRVHPEPIPSVEEVLSSTPWDDKWDRTVAFRGLLKGGTERRMEVKQHLSTLTPFYARTDATERWLWPTVYMTRELGPNVVRDLLGSHPDFAEGGVDPETLLARRFRYTDFMFHAGFDEEAEREVNHILEDKPSEMAKTKAEAYRVAIQQWRSHDQFETIKQMHNAGQFKAVRKKLADFNEKEADAQTLLDLHTRRDEYKAADKAMTDAARFLDEAGKGLAGGAYDIPLREAAMAIQADLQPDVLPRLDTFLGQARQAERQVAAGKAPTAGPTQLLSLAITGWLGALPDPAPATAVRLWHARQFLVTYLASDARGRKPLLDGYLASDRGSQAMLDEVVQLIPLLPPVEPEAKISEEAVELTMGGQKNGGKYLVQLPPEYRHGRNYPVLFVLHQASEGPEDMLKRWNEAAALNGYILVSPEWSRGLGASYGFTEREHAVVLDTLRDLRRRFSVDSDRVFLAGLGEGGAMAFDVGLSHPDLFAGVLPMSAGPTKYSARYYPNGQYLPFYIVSGDRSGAVNAQLRAQFEKWVSQYPMLWMQYKGRGVEWYSAEVPLMFDWMRGKQRQFPLQGLGVEKDPVKKDLQRKPFVTHRATDNRFYWATTDDIQPICLDYDASKPATLQARIELESNTIFLEPTGMKQVTLWLGSNGKGEPMVNFDKEVTVKWNGNTVWKSQLVTRRLDVLLDDLVQRGDRQRLFTAKLDFQTK